MTKRRNPRFKRTTGRRGTKEWVWYAVIIFVVVVVGLLMASQRQLSGSKIDERTLCQTSGPDNVTSILLDLTDPLSRTQKARLQTIIVDEIETSSTETMIALGVVSEFPERWGAMFAKCKPASGEKANLLYENPKLISERYQQEFLDPIYQSIDSMLNSEAENESPIMESLQSLIAETPDFTRASDLRKIIIVSDLLQNSDNLSFYRGEGWEYFAANYGDKRLAGNMSHVEVEIIRIPRKFETKISNEVVEGFWTRYFDRQGSRPPTVISLGDL